MRQGVTMSPKTVRRMSKMTNRRGLLVSSEPTPEDQAGRSEDLLRWRTNLRITMNSRRRRQDFLAIQNLPGVAGVVGPGNEGTTVSLTEAVLEDRTSSLGDHREVRTDSSEVEEAVEDEGEEGLEDLKILTKGLEVVAVVGSAGEVQASEEGLG